MQSFPIEKLTGHAARATVRTSARKSQAYYIRIPDTQSRIIHQNDGLWTMSEECETSLVA